MGEGDKMEGEPLKGEETQNIVAEPEKATEKVADPAPGMDRKIFLQLDQSLFFRILIVTADYFVLQKPKIIRNDLPVLILYIKVSLDSVSRILKSHWGLGILYFQNSKITK